MKLTDFEKLISQGKLAYPAYIFSGPEDFLKLRTFEKIIKKFIPDKDRSDNIFKIDCNTKEAENSDELIYSFAFNSSPRFFLFNDFQNLKKRKPLLERIYDNGIPADTFLIFNTNNKKVAQEISTKLKQQNEQVEFWRPFENQLPLWVKKEANELGGKIQPDAIELLLDLTGSELSILFQELKKLVIASGNAPITKDKIKESVRYLRKDSVFDFLEQFGNRRLKSCLRTLESLCLSGEPPQKIWFMLVRQLRDFRLFHELTIDRPDIFAEIKRHLQDYRQIYGKTDFKSNQKKKSIITEIQKSIRSLPPSLLSTTGYSNPMKIKQLYMALNFEYTELVKTWPKLIQMDLHLKSGTPDAKNALQTFVTRTLRSQTS
ncbi:MAG: DNA polymerase III subunit delta [Candidatus Rifleibacteriota bacterium]